MSLDVLNNFTLEGRIPTYVRILDESREKVSYAPDVVQSARCKADLHVSGHYGITDGWLRNALAKYPVNSKAVGILGSNEFWYEAIALTHGAKHVYVREYRDYRCESADVSLSRDEKVDAIFCISSVEHSGLGRYGDELDAMGDMATMQQMRDWLTDDGRLFLAVPLGQDMLVWNAHRIYGKIRLPMLLDGWAVDTVYGWDHELANRNTVGSSYQPVMVLRKG